MNIKLAYTLLVLSIILLVLNIINVIVNEKFNYFGMISNLLLIISMSYNVYNIKKNKS